MAHEEVIWAGICENQFMRTMCVLGSIMEVKGGRVTHQPVGNVQDDASGCATMQSNKDSRTIPESRSLVEDTRISPYPPLHRISNLSR